MHSPVFVFRLTKQQNVSTDMNIESSQNSLRKARRETHARKKEARLHARHLQNNQLHAVAGSKGL
jgi:hypothetical protein